MRSRRDRRAFIELPFRLHASAEQWIPPLRIERRLFLSPRFNKWFSHAEAELFLARRDGRVVGRISAQIDRNFNDYQGNDWGMFGFLELEEDPEVAERAARRRRGVAGRARPRPDGRADGLHDERRVRRADRGPRPRAVHQAALAPALLPAPVRGGGPEQGDRPVDVGAAHHRTARRSCRRSWRWPRSSSPSTASASARCPAGACAGSSTCSARPTTRPGRTTGASCPTPRRTSTPTPRTSSWSSTSTGSWWPRRSTPGRAWAWRSRCPTSTRC